MRWDAPFGEALQEKAVPNEKAASGFSPDAALQAA